LLIRNSSYWLFFSWFLVVITLGTPGCGDDVTTDPDAGDVNARLDILDPPGDAIGLTHGGRVTLRVRYARERGEVIAGAPVRFAMIATGTGESPAGSVLSADTAQTDSLGVARVDLVAGAQDTSFRVSVDARDAPTQYFYVTVAEGGFAKLYITPVHQGWRATEAFSRIEVRLYRAQILHCADLDVEAPPDSLSPPRSLSGFGGTVNYLNVTAGQPHTLVAWAHIGVGPDPGMESPVPVSAGCVDLGASELPASRVNIELPLRDRALVLDRTPARSSFDLAPVAEAVDAAGLVRPWHILSCEAGPGQLLLDCALDALAPDAALDCVATGTSALVEAVNAHRGAADASGCRPAALADTSASLDAELTLAVQAGAGFPVAAELAAMLADRAAIMASFELDSDMTLFDNRTAGETALSHRLTTLRALAPGGVYELSLGATSRPVIEQSPVPATLDGNALALGEHGFTLRHGDFARRAFAAIALAPRGLDDAQDSLGTALAQSVNGPGQTGCAGLSELVCVKIGQTASCLAAACTQGATALDGHLSGWWRALLAPGIDFALSGTALIHDPDGDLQADSVGRDAQGQSTGAWSATLWLSDGTAIAIDGTP
jgi:hypothetical protein